MIQELNVDKVKPLGEREVCFKDDGGKEHKALFRDLDTLLYQWQSGTLPKLASEFSSDAAFIASQLNWTYPVTESQLLALARQCEELKGQVREEGFNALRKDLKQAPAPPENKTSYYVGEPTPRFEERRKEVPVPIMSERLSPGDLLDIGCMVLFLMKANLPIEDRWGLSRLKEAGMDQRALEEVAENLIRANNRR